MTFHSTSSLRHRAFQAMAWLVPFGVCLAAHKPSVAQASPISPAVGCAYGYSSDPTAACTIPCTTTTQTTGSASQTLYAICPAPVFRPVTGLKVPGSGTFYHQYLGQVTGLPFRTDPTLQASAFGPTSNIVVSNASLSSVDPNGLTAPGPSARFVYADLSVASANTPATGVVLTFSQNGVALLTGMDQLNIDPQGNAACPSDVTAQIKVTVGSPIQLFGTALWAEVVTLQNTGADIKGPLQLAFGGLSPNAQLFGASAVGTCPGITGLPLQTVSASGLAGNASVKTTVTFTNSQVPTPAITFTPRVVAGGSQL